jgi:MEMO1 family protein
MIRKAAVAGMFYPSDPPELEGMVRGFIQDSGCRSMDSIRGIVSPHAGYVYSGAVAGAAFASAPVNVSTVVIIAPPHRYPVRGASVYDGDGYSTPLGNAKVNRELTGKLLNQGLSFQPQAHLGEHSAEVQVPFLQVRWPDAGIVVILQGSQSAGLSRDLAGVLADALGSDADSTLLVASSDLSHYHPQETAMRKDRFIIDAFLSGRTESIQQALSMGGEACGIGPILTLMHYARETGCGEFGEIQWRTSAEASGDRSSVVGYFAGYVGREGE